MSRICYTLGETFHDMTIILIKAYIKRLKYLWARVLVHLNGFKFKPFYWSVSLVTIIVTSYHCNNKNSVSML